MRTFPSVEARQQTLDAFYDSEAWLTRHDAEVIAMIASYSMAVLDAPPPLIDQLVAGLAPA
ncbi:hypothetical protein RCO27_07540 [Sphingosinicella sp. LHD-64]|uniref:hypothetical protein n=1 Tax=Sphingosinicella sp. LHD-64 TaxID=3072139 RepID=UPI00281009F3|nr:hypothetical protein [Sphingosinicella sp. LHD-64]MDQ8756081.1 hypothetical protein [Sphingosinicella sp. LHD-64]